MNKSLIRRTTFAAAGAAVLLSLTACGMYSGQRTAANPATGMGQESSLHTPQGETGSPHGHGATTMRPGNSTNSMGASRSPVNPATGYGQENSVHGSQGETGTPHTHQ